MKKQDITRLVKEILQGYSPQIGKTQGLTSDTLNSILKSIIDNDEEELDESKLCKRGQEYIKSRQRAGEKSSAYLSGRAVKVCKGQIKFKGKKQKDFKG